MQIGPAKPQPSRGRGSEWIRGNLLGAVAVFLALTGTALAAGALPKNSVGTKQLKNGAVTAQKVKKGGLTGEQINTSTLGTVPNASHAANSDQLGGLLASDFQLRVSGSCSGGAAIASVNQDGSVGCAAAGGPPSGPAGGDLTGTYPSPTIANGAITDAKVAAANKDGLASVPSLRTLGSGALQAMPGNATPGGPPSGSAGGALAGTYPNPTLNVTGGPCANGQALTNISTGAALTCAPGVYSDGLLNVAAGPLALEANTSGFQNSAFGQNALGHNTGGYFNSAFGLGALAENTTGIENTAAGNNSLHDSTTGSFNSAFGEGVLERNDTGANNSAVGYHALIENTIGDNNAALGDHALNSNTTADYNSAIGSGALSSNVDGFDNSAVGASALGSNTSGVRNSALGARALQFNTGSDNVAVGWHALNANTGSSNTALGAQAGSALTTGSSNVDIATAGVAGESNTIRIGTPGVQTSTYLAGVAGVTTGGAAAPVLVDANGQLGTTSSSRRFKRDIRPLAAKLAGLMKLHPVSFRYRRSFVHGANPLQFGLIAEQVAKIYPNLVVYGRDGKPSAVAYQELPALLLAQVQRQQRQNSALRARVSRQQAQIDWLMREVRGR